MKNGSCLFGIMAGALAVTLAGCGEKSQERGAETDAALVSVNGVGLMKSDVDHLVTFNMKIRRHQQKALPKKDRRGGPAESEFERQLMQYGANIRRGAVDEFILRQLVIGSVGKIEVVASNVSERIAKVAAGHRYADVEALKSDLTADEYRTLEKQTVFGIQFEEADRRFKESVEVKVGEAELDEAYRRLESINATAMATNRLAYALATNTYERIKKGEITFEKAVSEISQDPVRTGSGLWGSFKPEDIRKHDPKLATLMDADVKEGDVLPPVEADNQLLICKIGPQSQGATLIYRIVFRLALEWDKPTREKMRESLEYDKRRDACRDKFNAIRKSAKIILSPGTVSRIYSNNDEKREQKKN